MDLTIHDLVRGFKEAGIEPADHILVHSSLSSPGWIIGGADAVIDALVDVVGESGTVIFPTLTGCPNDSEACPPLFDAKSTCCWTGTIPEAARSRRDALRSLHPTHSVVAIGGLAGWFTSGHELVRTPCGFGSPYDKLADIGGKIVLLGVKQDVNTSFHHAEEIANVPYVLLDNPVDVTIIDAAGRSIHLHDIYLQRWGVRRDFEVFEQEMIDHGICRISRVGEADIRVMEAGLLRMYLIRRLLSDPLATLALSERVNWMYGEL